MHAKDVLGKSGEQAAAEYLESCGLRILDRNWRCATGEIDIVAVDRHTLVVAEVKARTSDTVRHPARGRQPGQAGPASPARGAMAQRPRHPVRSGPDRRGWPDLRRHRRVPVEHVRGVG